MKRSGDRRPRRQIYQLRSRHSSEDARETRRRPRRRIYQLRSGHSSEDTRETRRRSTTTATILPVTFRTQQRRHLKIEAAVDNLSLGVQYQRLLHAVLHARSIYHRDWQKRFFLGPLVQSPCSEPIQVSLYKRISLHDLFKTVEKCVYPVFQLYCINLNIRFPNCYVLYVAPLKVLTSPVAARLLKLAPRFGTNYILSHANTLYFSLYILILSINLCDTKNQSFQYFNMTSHWISLHCVNWRPTRDSTRPTRREEKHIHMSIVKITTQ